MDSAVPIWIKAGEFGLGTAGVAKCWLELLYGCVCCCAGWCCCANPVCASCCVANAALKLSNESKFGLNVGFEGCAAGFGCGLLAVLTGPAGLEADGSVIQRSSSGIGISCTGVGADDADAPLH